MFQTMIINKIGDPSGEMLQKRFFEFLENYQMRSENEDYYILDDNEPRENEPNFIKVYLKQAETIRNTDRRTIYVNLKHLYEFDVNYDLREAILLEYYSYLNNAATELMLKYHYGWAKDKYFYISFFNCSPIEKIRQLRTTSIGKLISIQGTITRTSEVRPELIIGSFTCLMCNSVSRNIEQQFRFTEPKICVNANCANRQKWRLKEDESVFCDWQKLRLQENPSDIPPGSMPRSMDIILRNEMVEKCKPGDKCVFTGSLLVVPDITALTKPGEKVQHQLKREAIRRDESRPQDGVGGLKNLGMRDMSYKMIFVCQSIQFTDDKQITSNEETSEDIRNYFSQKELDEIIKMKSEPNIYNMLTKCIAPNIYGHDEVKRGILLMLFGGVNKSTHEGIKLRGDINICIVGDPSTAKSQFLKYVCSLLPRAVYTSGKGSSAAGLTASVIRDVETGEFCIEAGALMLADNGICCIDEFDKMDSKDQVAIHEAMEQQTISIAKAGIQATLMARTSILAAANPLLGRYDKTKSLKFNIDISAPIMSRFDLFFVIVDDCEEYIDFSIAQHIVGLHQINEDGSKDFFENRSQLTQKQFLLYMKFARHLKPVFTKEAAYKLREEYKMLRQSDVSYQKTSYRITVRQLESLIRLSEALAKVHLDEFIHVSHVTEASRLLKKSIISVDMQDVEIHEFERNLEKDRRRHAENNKDKAEGDENENDDVEMQVEDERTIRTTILKGPEYEKIKTLIIHFVREMERADIRPKIKDIIEYYLENHLHIIENTTQADELTTKVEAVVHNLIHKESILIVTNEEADEPDQTLSLNINYDPPVQ